MKSIQSEEGKCLPNSKFELQKWMKDLDWLQKTVDQIQKDFDLSSLSQYRLLAIDSLPILQEELVSILFAIELKSQLVEQFLYRVDLPQKLNPHDLDIESLTDAVILRSFQKVWLRKAYDENNHVKERK